LASPDPAGRLRYREASAISTPHWHVAGIRTTGARLEEPILNKSYDYIIVGAGSAGCALANRLSENRALAVLLIECGPADTSSLIAMPRGIGKLLMAGNPHVWDYQAVPRAGLAPELWLKGRTLGGSSSVNGTVYVRGAPTDYDNWAALGCSGWGWQDIGPLFVALEDHQLGVSEWRGVGGPLKISVHPPGDPLCEAVLEAAVQSGTPRVSDINHVLSVAQGGMGYQPVTTYRGKRFSAARAFLAPVRNRTNLDVLTETQVLQIGMQNRRVTDIKVRDQSGTRRIPVAGELILAAGAIESPKLLQLSGIGPGEVLQAQGISVQLDVPAVGRNLREHRYLAMQYRVTGGSLNRRFIGVGLLRSLLDYTLRSKGPLTHSAHEVGGFVKTRPELDRPDAQIGVGLYSMIMSGKAVNIDPLPGLTIGGYFMRPESQGEIRIQSPDPMVAPYIDANHLSAQIDRQSAISLFHWMRRLATQRALAPWLVSEVTPGAAVQTDEQIIDAFLRYGNTAYHICGTVRMGSDAQSALDPQLRVRGVQNLRVADTSIMPTLVSGNTNAPAMVIGLRAAELIRQTRADLVRAA
jgi:choline dehydrogenase